MIWIGSCHGDSGGPLACRNEDGEQYLCGLVSWGLANCGRYPSVFAHVVYLMDWLAQVLPPAKETFKEILCPRIDIEVSNS